MMKISRHAMNLFPCRCLLNRRSGLIHRLSTCQKMCRIDRIGDLELLSRRAALRMTRAGEGRRCRWCWPENTKNIVKIARNRQKSTAGRLSARETLLRPVWRLAVVSLLGCGVWMLAGCMRTVYVPIRSHETVIDTVTAALPDSTLFRALFECDSNNRVILRQLSEYKGKQADQAVNIDGGRIEVVTRWQTKYIDRIHEMRDTVTIVEARPAVKPERHIPRFFRWCFGVALGTVLFVVSKLVMVFRR